jgi:hypothetical protein
MKQVVIMPGGFHPFHAGHYALYKQAQDAFPGADVYVAATNDTSTRPFPFEVKEKLAKLAGVKPGHFVQVKSPFQAREITANLDPENTQLIFVRSEKDASKPPQAGGVKKDGNLAYLQPLEDQSDLAPMAQHAYMAYLPTVEFGPGMTSATEIRTAWPRLNEKRKTALVMSLYPKTQTNPALAANVVKLLDTAMGSELNEGIELKFHTIELSESQIKSYAKKYFECYNIDQPHIKFVNNVKRFSSKKLTESTEANSIAPFIQMINSVNSPKTIKVGDYFSVLAFEIVFSWKEINVSGFTNPKEVVDIKLHSNGSINYIKFADGDRYPRLTPATYHGKPVVQTAYFDNAHAANRALTALALKVPESWELNTAEVEQGVAEATRKPRKPAAPQFTKYTNYELWERERYARGAKYSETEIDGRLVGVAVVGTTYNEWGYVRDTGKVVGMWYNKASIGSFVQDGTSFDDSLSYAEQDTTWPYMDESQGVAEEAGPVEAYGYVYDRRDQRVMWRKTFPSAEAAYAWADSKNATVLGTRSIEQTVDEDYIDEKK